MQPSEHHDRIRQITSDPKSPLNSPEWTLYTDGSGHSDGYGGYAATVVRTATAVHPPVFLPQPVAGATCTSTEQMEFMGLLHGLQVIVDHYTEKRSGLHAAEAYMRRDQPVIHWITDRESLALAVWRDPDTQQPVYSRRSTPHLWAMYSYYEPLLRVVPLFHHRQSIPMHNMVDRLASESRILMKEYITTSKLDSVAL